MTEKKIIHKELFESGKWFKMTLAEQLGNVGSDIDRAISWRKKGNIEYFNSALERALELLYLTIEDPKNKSGTLRELCRTRESLHDYFYGDNEYSSTDEWFKQYFFDFAYIAAIEKGR